MNQPVTPGPQAPQQQPAAKPQQQGQGVSLGLAGIGPGGMPRLKIGTGDYNPDKLWKVVSTGEGFANPRGFGAAMVGIAVLLAVANIALVVVLHRFYPYFYWLAGPLLWGGAWMLATGQPKETPDGSKSPTWARIGLAGCLVLGLAMGFAMNFFNFEGMLFHSAVDAANGGGGM
jgi:hypothetical protein